MEPLLETVCIYRERKRKTHIHTHTHTHPFLCISISQEHIKRQRCPSAYYETVISKYQFLRSPTRHLSMQHEHTLWYPSSCWTMSRTVPINHSSSTDKSQIVTCEFSQTSSFTHAVFTSQQSSSRTSDHS